MIIDMYSSPIKPGFIKSPQLPPEQNSITIHRSDPFKYDPWYWVTYGECSSERMEISCMISSTSSSAFSTSITLIATACPVRLSTLCLVTQVSFKCKWVWRYVPFVNLPKAATTCTKSAHIQTLAETLSLPTYAILLCIQRLRIHDTAHHSSTCHPGDFAAPNSFVGAQCKRPRW
jgi:hypothetical protein